MLCSIQWWFESFKTFLNWELIWNSRTGKLKISRCYFRKKRSAMADSMIESENSSSNAPLNSTLVDPSNNAEHSIRFALDLRNLKSLPGASNSSNGKIKRHRPVVRSQSSSISLLRQPPPSASSITSGTDESQHFRLPDQYLIQSITRAWHVWNLTSLSLFNASCLPTTSD